MRIVPFFFCLALLAVANPADAAPYNFEARPDAYTWGEPQATVQQAVSDVRKSDFFANRLEPTQHGPIPSFIFHRNQLVAMETKPDAEDAAGYKRLYDDFSAKWGQASAPEPCGSANKTCTRVSWKISPTTVLKLTRWESGDASKNTRKTHVRYGYQSSELYPEYLRELEEFGIHLNIGSMAHSFLNYGVDSLIGKRVRMEGAILELDPLLVGTMEIVLLCTMQDAGGLAGLAPGDIIGISGVIKGLDKKQDKAAKLILSQVKIVPPAKPRAAGKARGYFRAADLVENLAGGLEELMGSHIKGRSVKKAFSEPYMDAGKVVVDFPPLGDSVGFRFSLDNPFPDQSGDTLSITIIPLDESANMGIAAMIGIGTVLCAAQPGLEVDEHLGRISNAWHKGQPIKIHGWTYGVREEGEKWTFSLTAPGK